MKIIVDAMGGDNAPDSAVQGALDALRAYEIQVVLVGQEKLLRQTLAKCGVDQLPEQLEIVHAGQVITMEDNPATAFKEKKDSSMTVGLTLLREGKGDAFVCAGSTGALLSAATMLAKRIRGIRRAALAPVLPGVGSILIDCGATAEGKPEYLLQYAYMGSFYASYVLNRPQPRVALLNIGAEPGKGTSLQVETHALLQRAAEQGRLNFVGNLEPSELVSNPVDVIVADGYAGNIMLKTMEGTAKLVLQELKGVFTASPVTKLSYLLLRSRLKGMRKTLDANEVGGTSLLGLARPVIKAHGSSNAYAIQNAIRQAIQFASSGFIEGVTENIPYMRLDLPKRGEDKQTEKAPAQSRMGPLSWAKRNIPRTTAGQEE
ncbi:MAG: phosphate acyltransferase PlsX [Oscillospiraceae bacterium]|nr:phosphate acyltransferase PlsX [Oscillospiraceae bacterium]